MYNPGMNGRQWRYPGFWPTLVAVVLTGLCVALGFWQLSRAAYKDGLQAEFLQRSRMPIIDLQPDEVVPGRRVRVYGQATGPTLLLDNRVREGRPGYEVFVPYRLNDAAHAVLLHTGWVAAPIQREQVPELPGLPEGSQTGVVLAPLRTGAAQLGWEALEPGVYRVQGLHPAELAARLQLPLLPILVSPEPTAIRAPVAGGVRSRGYAVQWFGIALAALFVYVTMAYKRVHEYES